MNKSNKKSKLETLSPLKENILTVLAVYPDGIYNLHVLDKINEASQEVGRAKTTEGSFYPTIKRLEADGLVEGIWKEEIAPGIRRRYLKISGAGIKALIASRQQRYLLSEGKLPEGGDTLLEPRIN